MDGIYLSQEQLDEIRQHTAGFMPNATPQQLQAFVEAQVEQVEQAERRVREEERQGAENRVSERQTQVLEKLAALAEQQAKSAQAKERKEGRYNTAILTNDQGASGTSTALGLAIDNTPHYLVERIEKHQALPIWFLRRDFLKKVSNDDSDPATKKAKETKTPLNVWDDLKFAGDFSNYTAALAKFSDIVASLVAQKAEGWTEEAGSSVVDHVANVTSRFNRADSDEQRMRILLYDVLQRSAAFNPSAHGLTINVGAWSEEAWSMAREKLMTMMTTIGNGEVNIFDHLPQSSASFPAYAKSSHATASPSASTSYNKPSKRRRDSHNERPRRRYEDDYPRPRYDERDRERERSFRAGCDYGHDDGRSRSFRGFRCFACGHDGHSATSCRRGVDVRVNNGTITVRSLLPILWAARMLVRSSIRTGWDTERSTRVRTSSGG